MSPEDAVDEAKYLLANWCESFVEYAEAFVKKCRDAGFSHPKIIELGERLTVSPVKVN